jgi:hypothetical protein
MTYRLYRRLKLFVSIVGRPVSEHGRMSISAAWQVATILWGESK